MLHCAYRQVLLVGKDGDRHVAQPGILHQSGELVARLLEALNVGRVDHEQDRVRLQVVVTPELAHRFVAAQVPCADLERADLLKPGGVRQ